MFCSKCGKEIDSEAIICPFCGCATNNFSNNTTTKVDTYSDDYLKIHEFSVKAANIRTFGILAAILMFGIGIIFSIIIWVKLPKIKIPEVSTTNQKELAELEDAKRKLDLGSRLAGLPLIAIGLCIAFVSIGLII